MLDWGFVHDDERLEKKGMLKTWMGEATAQRGGRAKRMVRVTSKGMHAAKEFYEAMMRVSHNASWATDKLERAS
jgi:PadR family transcriptional regulator, regulatory protein PadR